MARKVVIGLVAVLGVCALAAVALYSEFSDPAQVYVQVDDNRVRSIEPHGGMAYSYTLDGVTPDGKPAPVTLDTERVLRDKAYLLLRTRPLVGVVSWEEVAWDQIPEATRAALPAPDAAGA